MNKFCSFSFLFGSWVLFLFVPKIYSFSFNLICLVAFVISTLCFFFFKHKSNYFDFDTIFVIVYFFVFFCYPVFIHPFGTGRFFIFNYTFNEDTINKSTALALTGIESYFLGNVMIRNNGCKLKVINVSKNVFPAYLGVVLLLIFILKEIIFPSVNIYKGEGSADPSASGGIWGYFVLFSRMIIMSVICFQFRFNMNNNKKWYKNDLVFWFFLIIFFIVNIRLGRRGIILQYLLIIFFYVSVISGGFKLRRVLFSVLLGLISLNIILITRSGGSGAFNFSFNVFDMALDLIINNRNTFLAVDYVEKNGVLFPPFLGTLLGVIPFLSSLFFNALNIGGYYQTSAVFFSYLTFGQEMQFGVGTNIIASLYLSLGILGVIVGMFCLGLLVSHLMNKFYQNSYFGSFAYTILVSYSVYWVRSEFFTFVRYMVWGLLFYSILSISKYFFKIYHS